MSFYQIFIKEIKTIFSNSTILLIVFGGSIMYALLYPTPYKKDLIRNQKIAIIDFDQTGMSRKLISLVHASPHVRIAFLLDSQKQAIDKIIKNEIFGYLIIPKNFELNLYKRIPANLDFVANASYFSVYGTIIQGLNEASNTLGDQIKIQEKILQNHTIHQNSNLLTKESIALFNFSNGYLNYTLAAILIFILHQTAIGGAMLAGAFQNLQNDYQFQQISFIKIFIARLLVFMGIYILLFLLFFGFFFQLYHVNIYANRIDFWCFALALIFSMVTLGILLGSFIRNTALPTQIVLISSLPIIFVLGFIWPSELIPSFINSIAHLIPAYHGIQGFLYLNQMGASLAQIMPHFFWLLGLGVFFSFCTIFFHYFYRVDLNKH